MKRISVVVLVVCFLLSGCLSDKPDRLSEERIKELAWSSLEQGIRDDVVGAKVDIGHRLEPSGVTLIYNKAPADVWKQAEVSDLSKAEIGAIVHAGHLQADSLPKEIVAVGFKLMLQEDSNLSYQPYRVYIEPVSGEVLGKQPGSLGNPSQIVLDYPSPP
ncbi:hypothetical protein [Cohnella sp. AR92]|uniref:hypothetical protein n=1 Tax=Cohnella sp. AR92 TaxID=648716 RepID=UPI000F8E43C4|nr:hypothetical protein [Cohnella sp. AR92]RUS45435.1 hypothetical protein ELR57_18915 [Cohnella sp. AR92]